MDNRGRKPLSVSQQITYCKLAADGMLGEIFDVDSASPPFTTLILSMMHAVL